MGVFCQSFCQKDLLNSSMEFLPILLSSLFLNSLYVALIFAVFTWYLELWSLFCIADECWSLSAVEQLFVLVQMEKKCQNFAK